MKRPRLKYAIATGELVKDLLERKGLTEKIGEYQAWLIWDEVVGPQIAAQARPIRIRQQVLEVRVSQPVWMQQLQLMKPMILKKLNERLGENTLSDIYLRRGRVQQGGGNLPARGKKTELPWKNQNLSPEECATIEQRLASVQDPELKEGLQSIMERQAKLEKAKNKK